MKKTFAILVIMASTIMFSCTKDDSDGKIEGHEYVDLGLPSGIKWATCNIGAKTPEDYGDYFAWGETSPKAEYTEENSLTHRVKMKDISGSARYDAATANWGSLWRMPTKDEIEELSFYCKFDWMQIDSVYVAKVIGPNGNSITLPVAGFIDGSILFDSDRRGLYCSSTPFENNTVFDYYTDTYTYKLEFRNDDCYVDHGGYRASGTPIRPVSN